MAVGNALVQAELLAEQARADPLQTDKYRQALEATRVASQLAESASDEARQRTQELIARLKWEENAARKDRELLTALLDVRGPREGPRYQSDAEGRMLAIAEPTADEQFTEAFRRWGLDVDGTDVSEAAALLKARPPAVVTELIAALDEWASERRRQATAKEDWQRLLDLASLLDDSPGSKRQELREITARDQLPLERALGLLSAALRPVPMPVEVPLGLDHARLRQLAQETDTAREPILGLLSLVRVLGEAGEEFRAEQLLRAAIVARPREVVLHHTLGQLLESQLPPRLAEAVECYGAARALRPDLGVNLANALQSSGRESEGLSLLARLVSETPTNPYLHFKLAYALQVQGQFDEAAARYRHLIELEPNNAMALHNLGNALRDKGDLDGAFDCYHKALNINPKFARAHDSLGYVLQKKDDLNGAIASYRRALEIDPKYIQAHINLGYALHAKGQLDEAVTEFRRAIALDPKNTFAHNGHGSALRAKGRLGEALASYRKAVDLDPKNALAHYTLGIALYDKGQLDEAVAEYRQAIALNPNDTMAHNNLGNILRQKGQLDEAVAEYRQAITLEPKLALAHGALGQALLQLGHYAAAKDSIQRALELLPIDASLRRNIQIQLRQCERLLTLDKRLPAILTGSALPANAGDAITLAWMCQQPYRKHYAASARLYVNAFDIEPRSAQLHRYDAACSAALAAAGQGKDSHLLPNTVMAMFRRWALGWLRDDLTGYTKLAEQNDPDKNKTILQQLTHWRSDPDLASVRDPQTLDRLPENERAGWQALWRDVDELAKRVANKDATKK